MRWLLCVALLLHTACGQEREMKRRPATRVSEDATPQTPKETNTDEIKPCFNLADNCPPPSTDTPTDSEPAPDNPNPPAPKPDSTNYTKDIAPIYAQSCALAGCHTGNRPAASIGLDNVNGVIINFFDSVAAIEAGEMPISNAPKITPTQLQTLKTWQGEGYPQ